MATHPAIVAAERDGYPTSNHLGACETLAVVEDEHGKPVEVDIDGTSIDLRVGRELASLSPEAALRIASALLLGIDEAKERQP